MKKSIETPTETKEDIVPKIRACFLVNFASWYGSKQVLDIMSQHQPRTNSSKTPAAPDPSATAVMR